MKLSFLLVSIAFSGVIYAEGAPAPAVTPAPAPVAEEAKAKEAKDQDQHMGGVIKQLDLNKDGILQAAEIDAAKSDKIKEKMKAMDTSADGNVDAAELEAGKKDKKDKKDKKHGEKPDATDQK